MVPHWLPLALWCILCLNSTLLYAQTSCTGTSTLLVTNTNDDGPGSLRAAIDCANATSGANTIQFNLTGTPPHIIYVGETLARPLVLFDAQTTIDGGSIPGTSAAPRVILDGSRGNWTEPVNGLFITADNCTVSTIGITNFPFNGIDVFGVRSATIDNNAIYNNGEARDFYSGVSPTGPYEGSGIRLRGESKFCIITRNIIGAADATFTAGGGNEYAGILVEGAAKSNFIGRQTSVNDRNSIVYNPIGIEVNGASACAINTNSFVCNDTGIQLSNTANSNISTPTILTATPTTITGTATPNSRVELFGIPSTTINTLCPSVACQGTIFIDAVTTDNTGNWVYTGSINVSTFDGVTATATDADLNTSAFSVCRSISTTSTAFCGSPVITVTNTDDEGDGSLRAAIECANTTAGPNTIEFNIPGTGPHIIYVGTSTGLELPILTDTETTIDGTSQAGYGAGFNYTPQIILDGSQVAWTLPVNGLVIEANQSVVYALEIREFPDDGIEMSGADNCIIGGRNRGNVIYDCGWEQDYFGGVSPSGPYNGCAIVLQSGSDNCIISGNYLGTTYDQSYSPGNEYCGVIALQSSRNNIIGGSTPQDGNIISNNERGVRLSTGVFGCQILNNSFICNSLEGINSINSANLNKQAPEILNVSNTQVIGRAVPGDFVEVYISSTTICPDDVCQGMTLIGTATAATNGGWTISTSLTGTEYITATATDASGNTSEFTDCYSNTTPDCSAFTVSVITTQDESCNQNNGSALLLATGGVPPYIYEINGTSSNNPSLTGLSAGTYLVSVEDNFGCRTSLSVQIGQAPPLTASFTGVSSAICGNATGAFTVLAQGGIPPYSYNIGLGLSSNNTFSFLGAGTYNLTISDATGCTTVESITIDDISNFQLNITSIQNSSCGDNNGAITLATTGGAAPVIYTLNGLVSTSPSFSNLPPGIYNIVAVDANGCVDEALVELVEQTSLSIRLIAQAASCDQTGGSITVLSNNGIPPIVYDYGNGTTTNNVLTNLNAGTYIVTATDATGCTAIESISVGFMDDLDIQITGLTNATCGLSNGSFGVLVNNGTPPYSFDYGNGSTNNNVFTNVAPGTYSLSVTDAAGCTTMQDVVINSSAEIHAVVANVLPASCSTGGQFSVFVSSGTFPFQFDIGNGGTANPTFTNLAAGVYNLTISDANGCTNIQAVEIPNNGTTINLNINTIDATCGQNTGGITVSASNGTPPYSYDIGNGASFSPFLTNLAIGTYVLTVTDASGCTAIESFSINQSGTAVIASIGTIQNASCGAANGAFSIDPLGGTPPYTFSTAGISNGTGFFSGLTAGIYNILVSDANGCSDVVTATVSGSPNLAFNVNTSDAGCGLDNGSITVNVTSGASPYIYDIGNGSTTLSTIGSLATGTYTLTVTDNNGCTATETITIGGSSIGLNIAVGTVLDATCGQANGGFSLIPGNGVAPYTYDIGNGNAASSSPIFSNLSSGVYTVIITDATGCSTTLSVTVNDSDSNISVSFAGVQNASCGLSNGAFSITTTGGNPPYNYAISGQTSLTPSFTNLSGGLYSVTITDADNCQSIESVNIDESAPLLIAITNQNDATCEQANGTFSVVVNSGTAPYTFNIGNGATNNPNFNNLDVGTYQLVVTDNAGCSTTQNVTISPTTNTLTANLAIVIDASCGQANGSFTINSNGGTPPYTYEMNGVTSTSPFFNNLAANTYNITVSDAGGCTINLSATVNDNGSNINSTVTNINDADCGQANGSFTINATGGNAPYSYAISPQSSSTNPNFTNLNGGTYIVSITDFDGCTATQSVTIEDDVSLLASISNQVHTTCGENNGSFSVDVTSGTPPFMYNLGNGTTNNNSFTNLAAATYTLNITDANGCSSTESITIQASVGVSALISANIDASCGQANGGFAITPSGGNAPYTFDIGNGPENNPIFSNLPSGVYNITITDADGCQSVLSTTVNDAASTVTASFNNIQAASCGQSNGSFNIIASGGNPPYSYAIPGQTNATSSTFNNLSGGVYNVSISDFNNCQVIEQISIAESDPLVINIAAQSDANCGASDGSFSVSVSSGTPPFNYDIGDGASNISTFNNLAQGTYNLTVTDANGCTDTELLNIQGTSDVALSLLTNTDANCGQANGSFTLSATGGTAPYSFDIGNGATNSSVFNSLSSGFYNVTLTDLLGCQDILSVNINDAGAMINADFDNVQAANCGQATGAFEIIASGGNAPYTYQVAGLALTSNPNFSNLAAGTYELTITDNDGCQSFEQINITSSDALVANISNQRDASCGLDNGAFDINIVSGTAPFEYILGGNSFSTPNFTNLSAGIYSLIVVDANDCVNNLSVTINNTASDVMTDVFSLQMASCGEDNGAFLINSFGGQPPYTYTLNGQSHPNNQFTELAVGTYTVLTTDTNGCTSTEVVTITTSSAALTAQAVNVLDATCSEANGSFTISVNTGTAPFLYNLNNTLTSNPVFDNLNTGVYNITVTDSNGCEDVVTIVISQLGGTDAINVALGAIVDANCEQANGGFALNVTGGTFPYSFDLGNGPTSDPVFSNLNSGTYHITVTDSTGCSATQSVTINQLGTTLAATATNPQTATCGLNNGSFGINASGGQPPYNYDIGFGLTPNPIFSNVSGGIYFVTVTDAASCSSVVSVDIDETLPVTADIVNINPANCSQDNGTFTVSINSGQAPFMYDIGNGATQNPNFSSLATASYFLTVTDANGCTTEEIVNIDQVDTELSISIDNIIDAACGLSTGGFMVNVSTGTAPFNFDIGNGNTTNPSFSNLASGDYTISISDANGCSTTQEVNIGDTGAISATITNVQDATCSEANAGFEIIVNDGTAPFTYNLGNGNTNSPNFNNLSAGTYTVSITDANGCTTEQEITLNSSDAVTAFIANQADATCAESNGSLTIGVSSGTAPFNYNIGNGNTSDPNFSSLAVGNYIITVSDANGCTTTQSVNIEQNLNALDASIDNLQDAICGQANGSFTVNVHTGTAPFLFDIGNGNISSPNFDNLAAGTYTVIISDANGCSTTQQITISDAGAIMADITAAQNASCGEANGSFEVIITGGTAPFSYNIGNGNTNNPVFTNLAIGTYTLSVSDANGCFTTQDVTINDTGAVGAFIAVQQDTDCDQANGSVTIAVSSGTAPFMYDIGGGNTFNPTFNNLALGDYIITISDANNCSTTQEVTINQDINSLDTEITNVQAALCGQANGSFMVTINAGAAPFNYNIGNGVTTNPFFDNLAGGTYTLSVTDANGCFQEEIISIENTEGVVANVGLITDANCGQENGGFSVNVSNGTAPYTYNIGNGEVNTPVFNNLSAGTYTLVVTDANGCQDTASITINDGNPLVAFIANQQNATCDEDNGSFTLGVSSGAAPFRYSIAASTGFSFSPNFGNLAEGNYIITITDANSCSTTQEVVIGRDANTLDFSLNDTQAATCGQTDGSFTVTVNSGDAPFTYNIGNGNTNNPEFTGLAAGTYTLSISDANGCFAIQEVLIEGGSDALVIGIGNLQHSSCEQANGAFTIQPNNGTPPFSYNIGNGNTNNPEFTSLEAGIYTLSVSDANGCFTTEIVTIENAGTSITAIANEVQTATCGQSNGSFTINATNGQAPYTYDIGFGASTNPVFDNVSGGVYFVTITDAVGCQVMQEVEVNETTPLTIEIVPIQAATCEASDASFAVQINTGTAPFTYDIGNGTTSDSIFTGIDTRLYTLSVTDANGCIATENIQLDSTTGLEVSIASQLNANCGQNNGEFSLAVTGGIAPYNYDIGNGNTLNSTFSNLSGGSYEVTIHDANGCFIMQNVNIVEVNDISINLSNVNNTTCGEVNGSFTILANGGTPPYSYDIGNGAVTNASFTGLAATTYNVTISDNAGCSALQTIIIEDSEALSGNVESIENDNCGQGSGAFTLLPTGGQSPYTFDIGNGASTNASFDGLNAGIYTFTITDATGCVFIDAVTIADAGEISASLISQQEPSCIGTNGTFSLSVNGGTAPYTYNIGNGNVNSANFTNLGSGSYTVSISDANGCFTTLAVELAASTVILNTTISELMPEKCDQSNASFTVNVNGGQSPYTFDIGNGASTDSTFTELRAGDYEVSITDANGCTTTTIVNIPADNLLGTEILETRPATCEQENGTFTITASNGTAPYTYDFGDKSNSDGVFTGLLAGVYSVTVTDANGCSALRSISISNESVLALSATNINNAGCGNANGSISVQPLSGRPPYVYNIGNGAQIAPNFNNLAPGDYTVSVLDFSGCRGEIEVTIEDAPAPFVSIYNTNTAICGASNGMFSVSAVGGTAPYTYNIGQGNTTNPNFENLKGGTYTVTITDANDCQVEAGVTIPINGDGPEASFILNTIGYFVELVNTSVNASEFTWTLDDGTSLNAFNILHDYNEAGVYNVCLTASSECGEDTFCREVMIEGEPDQVTEIGGEIMTETAIPIGDVIVNCSSVGDVNTQFDGIYAFGDVAMGNSYTVRPSKEGNLLNGLSTYDVSLIKNHILGTKLIDSPYKLIAADLNNSGSVTISDEIVLRQLLLGLLTELPNNTQSWRFIDASFEFPNPANPWATPFPEEIVVDNLDAIIDDANFIGLKMGDVNGNAITNGFSNIIARNTDTQWLTANINASRDEITINLPDGLLGAQFTLEFDANALHIQEAIIGYLNNLDEYNFNLTQLRAGKIALSWNNYSPTLSGGILLNLRVNMDEDVEMEGLFQITSSLIRAEAYTRQHGNLNVHDIEIKQTIERAALFQVYQNTPNPFDVSTRIPFYLPEASVVTLTLYDTNGRVLQQASRALEAGNNYWEIFREELSAGVIYYRVETPTASVTRKMVIMH